MTSDSTTDGVRAFYQRLLDRWNAQDAAGYAACFAQAGHIVGFDGSQADSAAQIGEHIGAVFGSHQTARYVFKIRAVQVLCADTALLRAVVGMVPPGASDINPDVNAIQSLVAVREAGEWCAVLLQSTPAAFHGRPEAAQALTEELRQLLRG